MRSIIIDTASYELLNDPTRYPGEFPIIGVDTGDKYGMHMKNPSSFTNTSTAFNLLDAYADHRASIAGSDVLQICAGKFRTPANAAAAGGCGYINYGGVFGMSNTPYDYSSIFNTGWRYVTAGWRVGINQANAYNIVTIKLCNISGNILLKYDGGTPTAYATAASKLKVFYRVVNYSNPLPTDAYNISSIWFNGNSQEIITSHQMAYTPSFSGTACGLLDFTLENNTATFELGIIPMRVNPNDNIQLYFTVGIPYDSDIGFDGITANIVAI
jgi:hypothetical protein